MFKNEVVCGTEKVEGLKLETLKTFYTNLKLILALKTAGNIILLMSRFYSYAIKKGFIKCENILNEIEIENADNIRETYLNKEQIKKLETDERITSNMDLYLFVLISTRTGARAGSIMKLRKSDVNLETNSLMLKNFKKKVTKAKDFESYFDNKTKEVLKQRFENSGKYDLLITSTYASLRKKLQRVLDTLFNYEDRDIEKDVDSKGMVKSYKQLLYSKKGLRNDIMEIVDLKETFKDEKLMKQLKEELEIRAKRRKDRIVIHSLRHSFSYNFLKQNGSSIFKLKNMLNHSDIKSTLRYAHDDKEENKNILMNMYDD